MELKHNQVWYNCFSDMLYVIESRKDLSYDCIVYIASNHHESMFVWQECIDNKNNCWIFIGDL